MNMYNHRNIIFLYYVKYEYNEDKQGIKEGY